MGPFKVRNLVSVRPKSIKLGPVDGQSQCYLSSAGVNLSIGSHLKLIPLFELQRSRVMNPIPHITIALSWCFQCTESQQRSKLLPLKCLLQS